MLHDSVAAVFVMFFFRPLGPLKTKGIPDVHRSSPTEVSFEKPSKQPFKRGMGPNKYILNTPPKTNIEPENTPLEKETHLQTTSFLGSVLVFGGV